MNTLGVKAPRVPRVNEKTKFFIALWRFQIELRAIDFSEVKLTDEEIDETKRLWNALVTGLRDGFSRVDSNRE